MKLEDIEDIAVENRERLEALELTPEELVSLKKAVELGDTFDSELTKTLFEIQQFIPTFEGNTEGNDRGNKRLIGTFFTPRPDKRTFLHLKTQIKRGIPKMFHFHLTGYEFGLGKVIDTTFVGYMYYNNLIRTNAYPHKRRPHIYVTSDGYIAMRLSVHAYYITCRLEGMRVGNGDMPEYGSVQFILSDKREL